MANVNDAPVAAGSATLAAIDEDTANPAGTTVAALFGGNFSDIDGDTLAGVAISSYTTNSSRGDYQVSSDGSNWFGLSDATEALALTLRSTDFIRFVPAANYNGPVTALSAHLIDSGQTVAFRATVDLTGATGGATHVSSGLVALGGATRLTGSGLSIMEWAPLSGTLPPLSEAEWQRLFALYRTIPQYALVNT
ncbi:MAG: COX15/CtaA family protein, partial [Chloroflexota bacterium]